MSEWQPIETAPRDGTEILGVIRTPTDEVKNFIEEHHAPCKQRNLILIIRYWRNKWRSNIDELLGYPTHWVPLPKPPITDKEE